MNFTASSKGKKPAQASSFIPTVPSSHHIPTPQEVIEISDSEPDSPSFTRVNQASVKFAVSSLATGEEVIEIMSSDAEDSPEAPHSPPTQTLSLLDVSQMPPVRPSQLTQAGESPDLPDLTPIPPQSSIPPPPHPEVSSPHEAENMMDVDNIVQHSPPLPPPPSPIPQVDLAVDALERTLLNVAVSSSITCPPSTSEPEMGPPTDDRDTPQVTPTPSVENTTQSAGSDDGSHPPPPSSSPSYHTPLPRRPAPSLKRHFHGGPYGFFKGASTSAIHTWETLPQNRDPPASPPSVCQDGKPPTTSMVTPPIPDFPCEPGIAQVNGSTLLSQLSPNAPFRYLYHLTQLT